MVMNAGDDTVHQKPNVVDYFVEIYHPLLKISFKFASYNF